MPLWFTRGMAVITAVLAVCLSGRWMAPYMNQIIYQTAVLVLIFVVVLAGAFRQRQFFLPRILGWFCLAHVAALTASYFLSGSDLHETSKSTLDRVLWPGIIWLAFLAASQESWTRRMLAGSVVAGLIILAARTRIIEGDDGGRIALSFGAGILIAYVMTVVHRFTTLGTRGYIATTATVLIVFGVATWMGVSRYPESELELVRRGLQTERAALSVSMRSFREHRLWGTGAGSIYRQFLRHRPPQTTIQGVPDRLDTLRPGMAVFVGESGAVSSICFAAMLISAFVAAARGGIVSHVMCGVAGAVIVHDLSGGAWFLNPAGGWILFAALGVAIIPPEEGKPTVLPGSFFVMGLSLIGGLLLLQQIYAWNAYHADTLSRSVRQKLDAGNIDSAANDIDRILGEYDPNRNEILSWITGVMAQRRMTEQALQNSLVLLQRDPDYPSVKSNIATFYVMTGRVGAAIPHQIDMAVSHPTTENYAKVCHLFSVVGDTIEAGKAARVSAGIFPREAELLMARASQMPDSKVQGQILIEAAAFSTNNVLRSPAMSPAEREQLINTYRASAQKIREGVGLPLPAR